jgi:hypothetical protein
MLEILTWALIADIALDSFSFIAFFLAGKSLHVPFFFWFLLVVLLIKKFPLIKLSSFATILDNRFNLESRLYSFYWYNEIGNVPEFIRRAQAKECLKSIDFTNLGKGIRFKVPLLLGPSLGVFLFLIYAGLNATYIPTGTVTKIAVNLVKQTLDKDLDSNRMAEKSASERDADGKTDPSKNSGEGMEIDKNSQSQSIEKLTQDGDRQDDRSSSSAPGGIGDVAGEEGPPGLSTAERDQVGGATSIEHDTVPEAPDRIPSQRVTDTYKEPGKGQFSQDPTLSAESVKDPQHLLRLFKNPDEDRSTYLDLKSLIETDLDFSEYPIKYRAHMENYFLQLLEWSDSE